MPPSCNRRLRDVFARAAEREDFRLYVPHPKYTTDNAAMIAAAAFLHLERGRIDDVSLNADPNLRL